MKFSVIIPIYNCEDYIRKCIDSILFQSYTDYELILIDDGSKDNSFAICKEYADKYKNIKLFSQENSGPSIARNRGLEVACGDYLLFVDSDDSVTENYFEVLDKKIFEYHPDIIVYGRIGSLSGIVTPKEMYLEKNNEIIRVYAETLTMIDYNSCCNKCYKRDVFESNTFAERTVVEEDLLYNLSAINIANSILFIEDVLYCYNQRASGSVTTKYNPNKFDGIVKAYEAKKEITDCWNDDRIINYYRDSYLIMISAAINNLIYDSCPFKYSDKISKIRSMYSHPSTKECATNVHVNSNRTRLMKYLIKFKLINISYLIHWIVFKIKNRK